MLGFLLLEISSIAEIVAVILAIPNNLLLLFCIFNKSPPKFGNYRYLMAFFTYQSIWFSVITLFLNVNYFTHKTSISIFVRRNLFGLPELAESVLICLACSSNCMMFVALSVQFIYRYFAMTKSPKLRVFDSWKMSIWYFGMVGVSLLFGVIVFICGYVLEKYREDDFRESLIDAFELPANSTLFYARMTYYTKGSSGDLKLDWCSLGCLFLLILSTAPVIIIFYCGLRTFRVLSKETAQLSNHIKLQKELFKALVIQSTVPCIFLFIPSLIYFTFPLFNVELGLFSNIAGITFVIYPVLDPLAVMYVIKSFRSYVFRFFCLSHRTAPKADTDDTGNVREQRNSENNEYFMGFDAIGT